MRAVRTAVGLAKLNFTLQSRHLRAAQWPEDNVETEQKIQARHEQLLEGSSAQKASVAP